MAKHENWHLTTEQLSAYIDKQLSAQEQARCKLHLQTCEQCQSNLATLQQTVAFLKALPEPALPRSFILPAGAAHLQTQPAQQQTLVMPTPPTNRRVWPSYLQRSLRAASVIAAVIGLVFLLSGVLPTLHTSDGTTATTRSGGEASPNARIAVSPSVTVHASTSIGTSAALTRDTTPTITASTPPIITSATHHAGAPAPPLFALTTDLGRQEIGWLLIALGIVGVLLTRRKKRVI